MLISGTFTIIGMFIGIHRSTRNKESHGGRNVQELQELADDKNEDKNKNRVKYTRRIKQTQPNEHRTESQTKPK